MHGIKRWPAGKVKSFVIFVEKSEKRKTNEQVEILLGLLKEMAKITQRNNGWKKFGTRTKNNEFKKKLIEIGITFSITHTVC